MKKCRNSCQHTVCIVDCALSTAGIPLSAARNRSQASSLGAMTCGHVSEDDIALKISSQRELYK